MKKKMKAVLGILLAVMLFGTIAGCGNGGNQDLITADSGSESEGTESTGEKTKIVFLRAGTEEYKKEVFMEIIEKFEAEYPQYTVEYQEAPWGDDMETKLNTGFASGTAADVINFSLASMGQRIPMGQYECLNDYVEGWEGLDDYYDSVLEAGSVGEELYGIGYVADARVFAYNVELFEAAGIENTPTNWDELKECHEKLTIKDENGNVTQTGFTFATNGAGINHNLAIFGYQNGMFNLVDESTDEILFNSPEGVASMDYIKELYDIGAIMWDGNKSDQNPFALGTGAMTIISTNEFNNINTGALEGKIEIAPMFSNKEEGTFCGMHFMFMNSSSKVKDASWEFIEFMSRKENMELWSQKAGVPPLRQSLEAGYVANNPEYGEYIMDAVGIGRGSPKVPYSNTLFNLVDGAMEEIYYGEASVQDALDTAAVKLQEEIDNQ